MTTQSSPGGRLRQVSIRRPYVEGSAFRNYSSVRKTCRCNTVPLRRFKRSQIGGLCSDLWSGATPNSESSRRPGDIEPNMRPHLLFLDRCPISVPRASGTPATSGVTQPHLAAGVASHRGITGITEPNGGDSPKSGLCRSSLTTSPGHPS